MSKDDVAGLVREARLDAKAFRENTVYDGEGDAIRLIANAERLDQYADALTTLSARVETLEAALGEICRDSNPDWTERRVYANNAMDDIHTIATAAYYAKP